MANAGQLVSMSAILARVAAAIACVEPPGIAVAHDALGACHDGSNTRNSNDQVSAAYTARKEWSRGGLHLQKGNINSRLIDHVHVIDEHLIAAGHLASRVQSDEPLAIPIDVGAIPEPAH